MPKKVRERIAPSWTSATKKGTPDHIPQVISTKPIIGLLQVKWHALILRRKDEGTQIPSGQYVEVDVYTVPDDYQLNIGAGVVGCKASCIQEIVMSYSPGIVGHYPYDIKGELIFGPLSSTIIPAGSTLTLYIYNDDIMSRDYSVSLTGVLEKVA